MATAKNAPASSAAKGAVAAKAAPAKASSSAKSTNSTSTTSAGKTHAPAAKKTAAANKAIAPAAKTAAPAAKTAAPAKAAGKAGAPPASKSVATGQAPAATASKSKAAARAKSAVKSAADTVQAPKAAKAAAAPTALPAAPVKPLEKKPPRKPYAAPVVEQHAVKGVTKDGIAYTKDFDAKFLTSMKALLLEERISLVGQAGRLEDEANAIIEEQEMGDVQFDDEGGEGDTMVVERSRDLVLSAQARYTVMEIDAAIERLAIGTYGYSLESGRPIPRERLEAIPWATMLVEEKVGGIGRR
jgi:RNA polymerase-binding transcription factor DksA